MASVMVVEDEESIAEYIQRVLERYGYEVPAVVASGKEAIEKAREHTPDLVLMDIQLEGEVDGVEAADKIHEELDIPIVYLTAYSDEETLKRAKITEPFGYILKPFKKRELYSNVEMALHKHHTEREVKSYSRELERKLSQVEERGVSRFEGLIKPRNSYLIKEKRYGRSLAIFSNLTRFGFKGLCLTTQHPQVVRETYDAEDLESEFVWLSTSGSGGSVLPPSDLTSIHSKVNNFIKSQEDTVVLILGMEYIITLNTFSKSFKLLNSLTDIITVHDSRLLVSIDSDALESRELSLLERSLNVVTDEDLIRVGLK